MTIDSINRRRHRHGDAGEANDARAVPGLLDLHAVVRLSGEAAIEPGGTDDEDLVAGQEHFGLVRLREFDRGEFGAGPGIDHGEPVGGEHIDPFTVGLDDVGLVDTEFLHIGAGEVDPLGRGGRVVAVERDAPGALFGGGEVGRIGAMSSTAISSTSMPRPQIGPPYQPPESKP